MSLYDEFVQVAERVNGVPRKERHDRKFQCPGCKQWVKYINHCKHIRGSHSQYTDTLTCVAAAPVGSDSTTDTLVAIVS